MTKAAAAAMDAKGRRNPLHRVRLSVIDRQMFGMGDEEGTSKIMFHTTSLTPPDIITSAEAVFLLLFACNFAKSIPQSVRSQQAEPERSG